MIGDVDHGQGPVAAVENWHNNPAQKQHADEAAQAYSLQRIGGGPAGDLVEAVAGVTASQRPLSSLLAASGLPWLMQEYADNLW